MKWLYYKIQELIERWQIKRKNKKDAKKRNSHIYK
jgi:hypothetical protein